MKNNNRPAHNLKFVRVIRKGKEEAELVPVDTINAGDTGFWKQGGPVVFATGVDENGFVYDQYKFCFPVMELNYDLNLPDEKLGCRPFYRNIHGKPVTGSAYNGMVRVVMEFFVLELGERQLDHNTKMDLLRAGAILKPHAEDYGANLYTQVLVPWDITSEELDMVFDYSLEYYRKLLGLGLPGLTHWGALDVGRTTDDLDYLLDANDLSIIFKANAHAKMMEFFDFMKKEIPRLVDEQAKILFHTESL